MEMLGKEIISLVLRIGDHYNNNIYNRYLRPILIKASIEKLTWDQIENFTLMQDETKINTYKIDEIYERILALAKFVRVVKKEVLPDIKNYMGPSSASFFSKTGPPQQDRIMQNIAVSNLSSNIGILSDLVNELYLKVVEYDKKINEKKGPVFKKIAELKNIGEMLV